jgi:tRNA A-37 threonylcarbamoyl transferase component Bud32
MDYDEDEDYYVKKNVCKYEYKLYRLVGCLYYPIPKLIEYNETTCELTTQKIDNICVSDMYGEDFKNVPLNVVEKIRNIIAMLYDDGFCYPDITGYNFIEDKNGSVWIIDFEHCFCKGSYNILSYQEKEYVKFIEKFISGEAQCWNPEFR